MDSIATQLAQYGVPLVGLNVFLQQLGLPIPAVPTMMLAGALAMAAQHRLPAGVRRRGRRVARRRHAVVLGRPPLRLPGAALPVPDLAVARHLRSPDRRHLRALGLLLGRRVEVRSGVLDGGAADRGRAEDARRCVRAGIGGERRTVGRCGDGGRCRVRAADRDRARLDDVACRACDGGDRRARRRLWRS